MNHLDKTLRELVIEALEMGFVMRIIYEKKVDVTKAFEEFGPEQTRAEEEALNNQTK